MMRKLIWIDRFRRVPVLLLAGLALVINACQTMESFEAERRAKVLEEMRAARRAEIIARRDADLARRAAEAPPPPAEPDPYAAIGGPRLPQRLGTTAELDQVVQAFEAHVAVANLVRDEVNAFGLRSQLRNVQRLRSGGESWRQYWRAVVIFPSSPDLSRRHVEEFYQRIDDLDQTYRTALDEINTYINRERSKPWATRN